MEHSELKTKKDTTLWGGAPQYDYIHYDNCTSYGIPSEDGGTGDDMHYQEKALNHIQNHDNRTHDRMCSCEYLY
ncbi:Chloride channel protein 1, partial [Ophiophagus hannah]